MNWLRELTYTLRKLNRASADHELDEEIKAHIDLEIEQNIKGGMSPAEARYKAMQKFGSVALAKEKSRVQWGFNSIEGVVQDVRYAFRILKKWPGFSFAIVLILALGIGATTAIFSAVNAVLLQPLPYLQPEKLVIVLQTAPGADWQKVIATVTGKKFNEWRDNNQVFENIGAFLRGSNPVSISDGSGAARVRAARVTPYAFATLGVQPLLGRNFLPEEKGKSFFDEPGKGLPDTVVILSNHIWKSRFASDPAVLGKRLRIDGDDCAIVGVMPAGFDFPSNTDIWLPIEAKNDSHLNWFCVIGRIKDGITQGQANAEMNTLNAQLIDRMPANIGPEKTKSQVVLVGLRQYMVGDVRLSLLILLGAVALVMAIVCANIANLLLARSATRQKEMAIRLALGASRKRLIRQLLTESCLLAAFGAVFGLLFAFFGLDILLAYMPEAVPRLHPIEIDRWVLAFAVTVSLLTGILFGLAPAWQASRSDLNASLKEGGSRSTGGRQRLRSLLVISEVSLALMLTIGAGLLVKSFVMLRSVDLGFNPSNALVVGSSLPEASYRTVDQMRSYYQQACQKLSTIPSITSVGLTSALPLASGGARIRGNVTVEGETNERAGLWASKVAVNPDYFRAIGIPLLEGREFTELDNFQSKSVVIISQSLAHAAWPNENPVGKRLDVGFGDNSLSEVIGVVDDVRQDDMSRERGPALYQSYLQLPSNRQWMLSEMRFIIRTSGDSITIIPAVRDQLQSLDKDLPIYDVEPMERVVAQNISDPRFYTYLLGGFSALALILAIAGLYGLISYSVTHRTHEIGVRLALGAKHSDVVRMIVKHGLKLTVVGIAIGLAGAYEFSSVLNSFLYKVKTTDMATFAAVAGVFMVVAFLSSYIPARRATKVDPMVALRYE
ncbi:MAG TPA: ABC transporter permease [Blastocatellia bacterium]|nr:ABC transporter permease [Blastocatellia bacterium]